MEIEKDVKSLCLDVFCKIAAAVSHDLKNCLAVINESSGLLDDLAGMVDEDEGVPAERVRKGCAVMRVQVSQGAAILKNLNTFAHSGDVAVSTTPLVDILHLLVSLTARQAAVNGLSVRVDCPGDIAVTCRTMAFEALLFHLLIAVYRQAVPESVIGLVAISEEDMVTIRLQGKFDQNGEVPVYISGEAALLMEELGGALASETYGLVLFLPKSAGR